MDDRMLHEYRREPDPRFARALREELRREERAPAARPILRALAAACLVAIVAGLFTVPAVRVGAQSFLDIFRVKRFAAVTFDESRIEKLRSLGDKPGLLVFDRTQKVLEPGPARYVPSREAASPTVGFTVAAPSYLPEGLTPDSVFVEGHCVMRLSVSEEKLRTLLQRLDLNDIQVPKGLDGRWIDVRKPPVVVQRFLSPKRKVVLVQARSPEVSVPAGYDVQGLVQIGLRVLGLDPGEARRVAHSVDWRSTLLVPVPMNASTFRQVTIHGQQGLLINTGDRSEDGRRRRVLLWTEKGRVFCIQGDLNDSDTVQMAESVS